MCAVGPAWVSENLCEFSAVDGCLVFLCVVFLCACICTRQHLIFVAWCGCSVTRIGVGYFGVMRLLCVFSFV